MIQKFLLSANIIVASFFLIGLPSFVVADSGEHEPSAIKSVSNEKHALSKSHDVEMEKRKKIQNIPIKLANAETLEMLHQNWNDSHSAFEHKTAEHVLSRTFWTLVVLFAVFVVLSSFACLSGAFKRSRLSYKLAFGFCVMIALTLSLATTSFLYVKKMDHVSHLGMELLELEENVAEQHIALNDFLLFGIKDKAYGETRIEDLNQLIKEYHKRAGIIFSNSEASDSHRNEILLMLDQSKVFEEKLNEVVHAFHDLQKGKVVLEERTVQMNEVLEGMANHHADELFRLEHEGTDIDAIRMQSEILQHLEQAEIYALKTSLEEAAFLLDADVKHVAKMEYNLGMYWGYLKTLESELTEANEFALLQKVEQMTDEYTGWLKRVIQDEAIINKDVSEMSALLTACRVATADVAHVVSDQVDQLEIEAELASVIIAVSGLLAGICLSIYVSRSISLPLHQVMELLEKESEATSCASNQVSAGSEQLAEGATEQAASIEETSASLEEVSSMTMNNADHAKRANTLARETSEAANAGLNQMSTMSKAMDDIQNSSDEISNIIKTIDDIAFQTNILALNAAVEAARAGEAGAGFAVVADEVRNLAQRSALAASETAEKIEDAIQKSSQGVTISKHMTESLKGIASKAGEVDELITQISSASSEQNQGISQITDALSQIDTVTQSNAACAEETANASKQLSQQSMKLKDVVSDLGAVIDGQSVALAGSGDAETQNSSHSPRGFYETNPNGSAMDPSISFNRNGAQTNSKVSQSEAVFSNN